GAAAARSGAGALGAAASGPRLNPSTTWAVATSAPACAPGPQAGQATPGSASYTTLPVRSRTSSMNHGVTRKPPLAKAVKPRATVIGATDAVPSDMDRLGG